MNFPFFSALKKYRVMPRASTRTAPSLALEPLFTTVADPAAAVGAAAADALPLPELLLEPPLLELLLLLLPHAARRTETPVTAIKVFMHLGTLRSARSFPDGAPRRAGQLTVSVPTIPAARWPGTVQKNVYLPGFSVTVSFLLPPWKVGVAPTSGPLVPCWSVRLWATDEEFVKSIVTFPALAVSVLLVNFSAPLGSAPSEIVVAVLGVGAAVDVDVELEVVLGAAALLLELLLLELLELPQAATATAITTATTKPAILATVGLSHDMSQVFTIAGASLAGAKAAETLRAEGFDGRIVLCGSESERPYERPELSKKYLRGEFERERLYVHPEAFYADQEIELRTSTRVARIHAGASELELEGGERLSYDRLLITTGAGPRRLSLPGEELDGVRYLRTIGDSDALRQAFAGSASVVVVGAGWIGCEVAASARELGLEVTVIEPQELPLERVLGPGMGAFYRDVHADHGVRMLLGTGVEAFEGSGGVERVRTSDGNTIDCELVVVGIGVQPRTALAQEAGLAVQNGILVDERLETSAPGIYAAGDVANQQHPLLGERVRVEHWANALNQGPAAARSMLGSDVPYERLPYFYSDQYDVGMEYTGLARPDDELLIRGDLAARELVAFWLREGRVIAGMNVNVWDVVEPIQALIRSRAPVDRDRLSDPDVPLGELVEAS
jgi:3-phenylpropionate/trans-cinnamate dioxygenase ferredoxin reductase component